MRPSYPFLRRALGPAIICLLISIALSPAQQRREVASNGGTGGSSSGSTGNPPPPGAVTNLQASAYNGKVILTWTQGNGATSYTVYRNASGGFFSLCASGITPVSFTDTAVTDGITYGYEVYSVNGVGIPSTTADGPVYATPEPIAPSNLTATPEDQAILLNWTAGAGASSYNIYRGTSFGFTPGPSNLIANISGTNYNDTNVSNLATYTYVVYSATPYNTQSTGFAGPVSASPGARPSTPTGLVAVGGTGSITLTWTAVSGATSYTVLQGPSYTTGPSTSSTSYTFTGLGDGVAGTYEVNAVNRYGASGNAGPVSAYTLPSAPQGLTATPGTTSVGLYWQAVTSATSYSVQRLSSPGGSVLASFSTGANSFRTPVFSPPPPTITPFTPSIPAEPVPLPRRARRP